LRLSGVLLLKIKRGLTIFFKKYFPNEYFGLNIAPLELVMDITKLEER
jgi:hypothetical protein